MPLVTREDQSKTANTIANQGNQVLTPPKPIDTFSTRNFLIPDVYEPDTQAKQEEAERLAREYRQTVVVEAFEKNNPAPQETSLTPTVPVGRQDTLAQQNIAKDLTPPVNATGAKLITQEKREGLVPFIATATRTAKPEDYVTAALATAGLAAGVASPVLAGIGAAFGFGISQTVELAKGGDLFTLEESVQSLGAGAAVAVVGGEAFSAVGKVAPVIFEKSLAGAVTRIALTTGVGEVAGGTLGGAQAWANKQDIFKGVREGAVLGGEFGLAFGVIGEVAGFAAPKIKTGFENFANRLSPERAMVNRVVLEGKLSSIDELAKPADYSLTQSDKILGKLGLKTARTTAMEDMYQKITAPSAPKASDYSLLGGGGRTLETSSGFAQQLLVVKQVVKPVVTPRILTTLNLGVGDLARAGASTSPLTSRQLTRNVVARYGLGVGPRAELVQQSKTELKTPVTISIPRMSEVTVSKVQARTRNPFLQYQGKSYYQTVQREETENEFVTAFVSPISVPKTVPAFIIPKVVPSVTLPTIPRVTPRVIIEPHLTPIVTPRTVIVPKTVIDTKTLPIQVPKQTQRTTVTPMQLQRTIQRQLPKGLNLPLGGGAAGSPMFGRRGGIWVPRKHPVKTWEHMLGTFGFKTGGFPKSVKRLGKMEAPKFSIGQKRRRRR